MPLIRLKAARRFGLTGHVSPCGQYLVVEEGQITSRRRSKDWPFWALCAALFAAPEDCGIGDTLARTLGGSNSEAFKRHSELVFGVWETPCGRCGKVAGLNALYPY